MIRKYNYAPESVHTAYKIDKTWGHIRDYIYTPESVHHIYVEIWYKKLNKNILIIHKYPLLCMKHKEKRKDRVVFIEGRKTNIV